MRRKWKLLLTLSLGGMLLSACGGNASSSSQTSDTGSLPSSSSPSSESESESSSKESIPSSSVSSEASISESESSELSTSSSEVESSEPIASSSDETSGDSDFPRIDVKAIYNEDAYASDGFDTLKISEIRSDFEKIGLPFYPTKDIYLNRIEVPSHDVGNIDEFSDVLDYHAFYGDDSTFEVTLNSDYVQRGLRKINEAFYNSKLCVGVVGLNYQYDSSTYTFSIQMLFNEEAGQYRPKPKEGYVRARTTIPYGFPTDGGDRDEFFEDFPYLEKDHKGVADVYNSEQLLYALEQGYLPNIIEGSPAEVLMEKAKEILRKIIKNDMGDFDKIAAIYSYLTSRVSYDDDGDYWATFAIEGSKFPDYVASSFRSFYAEGGLIDGKCVCHGYAKSFNILANIEGLTSIKVSGRDGDDSRSINSIDVKAAGSIYGNHGYCYVLNESDGLYYIVDPTYVHFATINDNDKGLSLARRYAAMIDYDSWSMLYSKVKDRFHNREDAAQERIDFSPYIKLGKDLSFHVEAIDDLYDYFKKLAEYMADYNDSNYLGENWRYQVNLTIDEIEESHYKIDRIPGMIWDALDNAGLSNSQPLVYGAYYFTSDSGVVVVLDL